MKKILSLLLVFAMIFSLTVPAYAADTPTVSLTADKSSVAPGETVNLTLSIDQAVSNLNAFQFNIIYDAALFELGESTIGTAYANTVVGNSGTDANGKNYVPVSGLDTTGKPVALSAGTVANISFKALAAGNASFTVEVEALTDYDDFAENPSAVENKADVTVAETTDDDTTEVYVYYASEGQIQSGKDGTLLNRAPVTVTDLDKDGTLTMDDALSAFHELYHENGSSGYTGGGWISTFWSVSSSNFSYVLNHKWVYSTKDPIKDEDVISVYSLKDSTGFSDLYTYFEADSYEATALEAQDFNVKGYFVFGSGQDMNDTSIVYNAEVVPEGATVTASNGTDTVYAVVDSNGSFTLTFPTAGTYTVLVDGTCSFTPTEGWYANTTYNDAPVVPAMCTVEVEAAPVVNVTGVTLDKETLDLTTGGTAELVATVAPEGASDKSVTWSSSNSEVAAVVDGTVTALKAGDAIITVATVDGGFTDTCTVTVSDPAPVEYDVGISAMENGSITASPAKAAAGTKVTLTVEPAEGYELAKLTVSGTDGEVAVTDYSFEMPASDVTVSASFAQSTSGYTVTMPADKSNIVGETVEIPVVVSHTDGTTGYNAFDMSFSYEAEALELTSTVIEGMTVTAGDGTVRVQGYGDDKAAETAAFTLSFKALTTGESTVTLTAAKVDNSGHAVSEDAPDASKLDDSTLVSVTGYTVNLPDDFTGDASVAPGKNYTFTAKDKNYKYSFTDSTMGEAAVTVKDNGDGSFTVENVTGNLVIVSSKEGKSFNVTLGTDMTGDATAQYMAKDGYVATLNKASGYNYVVTVKINNVAYTGYAYDDAKGTYTIPGKDIVGNIVFTVTKTAAGVVPGTSHAVTVNGGAAGAAEGFAPYVANGANYTLNLKTDAGYKYTVTATVGGEKVTVTDNGSNGFTVANVTGALVFTVEKVLDITVEVNEYVTLDGKNMYLVTVTGTAADSSVYTYDGQHMYYSEQYKAWSYLTVEGSDFTVEAAAANVAIAEGSKVSIAQTYDVNESGVVDINDAQLTYDIYNAKYEDFAVVSMQKVLKADVNGDKMVNTADAAAVVANIQ